MLICVVNKLEILVAEIGGHGHPCPRTTVSTLVRGHGRGHGHLKNQDRGHGRGHGHEFFEKSRTRTRGGQAADMRVHRSLIGRV